MNAVWPFDNTQQHIWTINSRIFSIFIPNKMIFFLSLRSIILLVRVPSNTIRGQQLLFVYLIFYNKALRHTSTLLFYFVYVCKMNKVVPCYSVLIVLPSLYWFCIYLFVCFNLSQTFLYRSALMLRTLFAVIIITLHVGQTDCQGWQLVNH